MYRTILSTIILLSGIALGGGGIWLATLGGSWFYILLGAALIVSGALMMARNAIGLGLYALTLLVTLGWSLWEVGPDWWSLAPRGALLVVLLAAFGKGPSGSGWAWGRAIAALAYASLVAPVRPVSGCVACCVCGGSRAGGAQELPELSRFCGACLLLVVRT